MAEQSEVAATALISEETAAGRLGITGRSLNNLRLSVKSICPPVLIAGDRRTKWFWAPAQFGAWQEARPGRGWRAGQTGTPATAAAGHFRPAAGRRRRGPSRGAADSFRPAAPPLPIPLRACCAAGSRSARWMCQWRARSYPAAPVPPSP